MMNKDTHILVVDDDAEIRDVLHEYLTDEGLRVTAVADGDGMRRVLGHGPVDLVVLDVKLPQDDGFRLAAELRRRGDVGIIMLSQKEAVVDRVVGLEVGADDYVSKPFDLRELLARIRSVLRRLEEPAGATAVPVEDAAGARSARFRFADWQLDVDKRRLVSSEARAVELSSGEFDLLLAFIERPKRVLSRDQLLDFARHRTANLFDRSIDVQVGRLRRKIEIDPRRPALIKTVRSAGYIFAVDVERLS